MQRARDRIRELTVRSRLLMPHPRQESHRLGDLAAQLRAFGSKGKTYGCRCVLRSKLRDVDHDEIGLKAATGFHNSQCDYPGKRLGCCQSSVGQRGRAHVSPGSSHSRSDHHGIGRRGIAGLLEALARRLLHRRIRRLCALSTTGWPTAARCHRTMRRRKLVVQ